MFNELKRKREEDPLIEQLQSLHLNKKLEVIPPQEQLPDIKTTLFKEIHLREVWKSTLNPEHSQLVVFNPHCSSLQSILEGIVCTKFDSSKEEFMLDAEYQEYQRIRQSSEYETLHENSDIHEGKMDID